MTDKLNFLENRNILLVEDNPGDARLVEIYLRDSPSISFDLTLATRLQEGIDIAKEKHFDIVLLDLTLPDSTGLDTLQRAVESFPDHVSIVVLTGVDDENFGVKAVEEGAQDYLVKGQIDTSSLTRAVLHAIKRGAMQKKVEESARNLRISEQRLLQAQSIAKIGNFELEEGCSEMYWSEIIYLNLDYNKQETSPTLDNFLQAIPEGRNRLEQKIAQAFESGEPFTTEHKLLSKVNNKLKYIRIQGQLDAYAVTTKKNLIGTIQDISDYKNAEELYAQTEKRYKTIFEESQDSIYITTHDGVFVELNESLINLFGYKREELENIRSFDLYNDPEQRDEFYKRMEEDGRVKDFEVAFITKDGKILDCLVTSTRWSSMDSSTHGFHGIIRDVTEQKRTQELVKAKEVAERSAKIKEQFLANMSHEIRTPMNVVVGMTHLLENTPLNGKQQEYINALKLSSDGLLRLINNILDFSKIEAGKLELEQRPFRLYDLINEILQTYKYKAQDRHIDLYTSNDVNLPEVVIGDSVRLHQIINNLVSNAIKYTEEGEIQIRTRVIEEDDQQIKILFAVKDSGIGIPEDKLQSVFDAFTQASKQTTRLYGGTGLGLSIVKKLVDIFGGEITVTSKEGVGSTFSVVMPFQKNDGSEPIDISPSKALQLEKNNEKMLNHPLPNNEETMVEVYTAEDIDESDIIEGFVPGKVDILLVEDHKLNQIVATDLLKKWASELTLEIAENGQEAIDKLADNFYDIILMDISMPVMDGYEAATYIRNEMEGPVSQIPIIAMTAHAFNTEAEKCFKVGMNEFVSKPINPEVLYAKLNLVLSKLRKEAGAPINTNQEEQEVLIREEELYTHNEEITNNIMFNFDYLESLTGGDIGLKIVMMETIINDFPTEIARVENDCNNKDWDALKASAHKIKSTCSYLGVSGMVDNAQTIENNAWKREQLDSIDNLVQKLALDCRKAHAALKGELENLKSKV